jgi:hypothetical protein
MTEVPILTDKAKIDKWNEVCLDQDWAKDGELDKWLIAHGIAFTPAGSCVGMSLYVIRVKANEDIDKLVTFTNGEEIATHVLEVLTGIICFSSTELENLFWQRTIDGMKAAFALFVPPEIVPKAVRESLKYPKDDDQGTVS